MKILFDNVIKNAQHIYDWGELESVDLERMRGIIDVLKTLKEEYDDGFIICPNCGRVKAD